MNRYCKYQVGDIVEHRTYDMRRYATGAMSDIRGVVLRVGRILSIGANSAIVDFDGEQKRVWLEKLTKKAA